MILRRRASVVLFSTLALPILLSLAGCSALKSIAITPASGAVTLNAVGQTAQFTALGTSQMGSADPTTSPISGVTWSVSNPNVATISSTGLATAVGPGNTQILATSGGITATSDLTVTIPATTTGTTSGGIATMAIIPGSQSVSSPGQTSQFLAIGTTASGSTVNLTNQVAWSSSSTQIGVIGASSGLATAVGQGTTTITALYNNTTSNTVVAASATFTVVGGTTEKYTAVTITPGAESLSASGQTGQFIALAASGSTGLETDVTSSPQIQWSSSIASVATVSSSGLVTGVSVGSAVISAVLTNADGTVVSATADVTTSATSAPEPLISLTIIPGSITLGNLQGTGQFLAIGTYATAPYVRDLTNSPNLTWISSFPTVFPVDSNTGGNAGASAGVVTAYGSGTATIIAEAVNPSDGTIQTATATFNCPLELPNPTGNPPTPGSCYPGTQAAQLLSTLTIFNEGLNTTTWEVTAPSATGTANVLHCGPGWAAGGGTGGSVCVATYPFGTTVVLKATGSNFGGWSYNCTPSDANGNTSAAPPITAAGPNYCSIPFSTLTENSNVSVGVIFN